MTALTFEREKAMLAREILGISDMSVMREVKRRLSGIFNTEQSSRNKSDEAILNAISGKWRDARDADTMVDDIYKSRTSKADNKLISILTQ